MNMELGKKLKTLREQHGFSQIEIANYLHVTKQAVSKWENDLSMPENDKLDLLAKLYDLSIEEMLENRGKKKRFKRQWIVIALCLCSCFFFYKGMKNIQKNLNQTIVSKPLNPNNPTGFNERKILSFESEFDETKAIDLTDITKHNQEMNFFKKIEAIYLPNKQVRFRITVDVDNPYLFYAVGGATGEFFDFYSGENLSNKELIFDLDCLDTFKYDNGVIFTIATDDAEEQVYLLKDSAMRLNDETIQ